MGGCGGGGFILLENKQFLDNILTEATKTFTMMTICNVGTLLLLADVCQHCIC
jgi:hypothetical protein